MISVTLQGNLSLFVISVREIFSQQRWHQNTMQVQEEQITAITQWSKKLIQINNKKA